MPINYREIAFESSVEACLLDRSGYSSALPEALDRKRAIFPDAVIDFIKRTQKPQWAYLYELHKDRATEVLLDDLCRAMDSEHEGFLMVLRHGFKCFGREFRVAYFAPASGLNPETEKLYKENTLAVTRQLHYSVRNENALDLTLSINGLPFATIELKNPLTGQNLRHAIKQYQEDRDPSELIFQFKKRTLVHFAVDPDEAWLTTKISGSDTRFIPFNKGRDHGAGNPDNPDGYKTSYLWENILARDSVLEILGRFIHLEVVEKTIEGKKTRKENLIFPRYHQLEAVRKLLAGARSEGAGNNYLIQHSAGSGKSNTIAWLAHRLSSLHNDKDEKIFGSVVVITDRLVLDQQLQNTIYQFEHKKGVVEKINEDSEQLARALASAVPIVVTTLQKFPFVSKHIGMLPSRTYAVIIDEAHSSQSGEAAQEMKGVLSGAAIKEKAKSKERDPAMPDYEEAVIREMEKRGRQDNISFFAFTATPKYKTKAVFGRDNGRGDYEEYHLYSMRQAIEEEFILDVLEHYVTYKTYYHIIKSIEDDPLLPKRKAARALARFMSLHPHNIEQKTEVMVEHFRNKVMHKIGGRAKAMVVTASRLHAVRYKQSFDRYLAEKGYTNIKTLVAFSGTVIDPDVPNSEYSEVGMNKGIKEKELPEKFSSPEYQVLLVAEKYQTGFDQPLLHTMYVDKRLDGIQAVQTLSRLNRTCPGKKDTFILDFVNKREDIIESFQPYYEKTVIGEKIDIRHLYEIQAKIDAYRIYYKEEVEEFAAAFYLNKNIEKDHAKLYFFLNPAVGRFKEHDKEEQELIRSDLAVYRSLYSFLSQILPFQDSDLEKLYSFVRFLLVRLPKRDFGPSIALDDEVSLKYYRLEKIAEGNLPLLHEVTAPIKGPASVGTKKDEGPKVALSSLIEKINDRFGTDWNNADALFFESIREDAARRDDIKDAAKVNTFDNFLFVFMKLMQDLVIDRMDRNNDELAAKMLNNKELFAMVAQRLGKDVWNRVREEKVG
jgi:type I restriction enzyme R subunit